jgi:hypothetical protein
VKLSPEGLISLLVKTKVEYFYLGNGRGRGYRVSEAELDKALSGFKVVEQSSKTKAKKINKFNMSTKDILAQLTK